jgi:hypothetical protein
MPAYQSATNELNNRGFSKIFNGKSVDKLTIPQLKNLLKVFQPQTSTADLPKHELCLKLVQARALPLKPSEQAIITSLVDGQITAKAARVRLSQLQTLDSQSETTQVCDFCLTETDKDQFPSISSADGSQDGATEHSHLNFTCCSNCLALYIEEKASLMPSLDVVPCPEHNCTATLDASLMRYAPADIQARYNVLIATNIKQAHFPTIPCSNLKCTRPISLPNPTTTTTNSPSQSDITCPSCTHSTCLP